MIYSDVLKIFLLRNKTSDGIRIKNDNISSQHCSLTNRNQRETERQRLNSYQIVFEKSIAGCFSSLIQGVDCNFETAVLSVLSR